MSWFEGLRFYGDPEQGERLVGQLFQVVDAANSSISYVLVCVFSLLLRVVWHRTDDVRRSRRAATDEVTNWLEHSL